MGFLDPKVKCPVCGREDSLRNFANAGLIIGKDEEGYILVKCKCESVLRYTPISRKVVGYIGRKDAARILYENNQEEEYVSTETAKDPSIFRQRNLRIKDKVWNQFQSKTNTEDVLLEKARVLAPLLYRKAMENTKSLFDKLEDKVVKYDEDKIDQVFFETLLFYINFVDRIAFLHLQLERRNIFVDGLFLEVRENLSRACENRVEAEQYRSFFTQAYNMRQEEYGKSKKLFPEKDNEPLKDTLFWQFGEKIADIFDREMVLLVTTLYPLVVFESMKNLKLPELFEE